MLDADTIFTAFFRAEETGELGGYFCRQLHHSIFL